MCLPKRDIMLPFFSDITLLVVFASVEAYSPEEFILVVFASVEAYSPEVFKY